MLTLGAHGAHEPIQVEIYTGDEAYALQQVERGKEDPHQAIVSFESHKARRRNPGIGNPTAFSRRSFGILLW